MAGEIGEVHRRKADPEEGDAAAHGFRDFRKGLEKRKIQMQAEDAEAAQNLKDEAAKSAQITKELDADRKAREIKEAQGIRRQFVTLLGFGDAVPEDQPGTHREMSDEQRKEYESQLSESLKRQADAQEKINKNVQERAQIEGLMTGTERDASAESAKNMDKKKKALDKHFDHFLEESGNEFTNRRNRINRDQDEQFAEIDAAGKAGIYGEDDVTRRKRQARDRAYSAGQDVSADERRAQSRFMRGMESHQKGTGSVAATRERLEDDLLRAEKLFAPGRQQDLAKQQAYATAEAETQRIMNANRAKGGQFFGIEEYSKHLMSQIASGDPDETAIRTNTFNAAEALNEIVKKMHQGFVIGAN
jgi:hypothetical protein